MNVVRGIRREDEDFFSKSDLLLWLAKFGESPRLSDDQRLVVEALVIDLRTVEFEPYDWREDERP